MSMPRAVADARRSERTRSLLRTFDPATAEFMRALLAVYEIQASVLRGDPIQCGVAVFDVLVLASEHARAAQDLQMLRETIHTEDWRCFDCEESVPSTFDLCWNCGTLHPELENAHHEPVDSQRLVTAGCRGQ